MSGFLLSISLGNVFTGLVNHFIQNSDGTSRLAGPQCYLFFAALMLVASVGFIPYAGASRNGVFFRMAPLEG